MILLLLCSCIIPSYHGWDPINRYADMHIDSIQTNFYDIHYYHSNETILENVNLLNNPHANIQEDISNADDVPEIRVDLNWDFKFYGHFHSWISISPNGFLTTHPISCNVFCNWWGGSNGYRRYIAPLMSDFDPGQYDYSHILYFINNTEQSLSVQWHNVTLWSASEEYQYDFQVKLQSDGTVHFYYFNIPQLPNLISIPSEMYYSGNYTTVIGMEDAGYQYASNGLYYIRPLSPISINGSHALRQHIVIFTPRTSCIDQLNCTSCQNLRNEPGSNLECGWCPNLGLCSDGLGREIYEYQSSDYCTDDEMISDLFNDVCIDYEINERPCNLHDHVVAKYPSEEVHDGISEYHSGVIIGLNGDTNTYVIRYDNAHLNDAHVQYSWVHPCSTVSYDYSSSNLLPHCTPHCESIPPTSDRMSKTKKIITSIGISIAIIIVLCALAQFVIRDRRRRNDNSNTMHIAVNQASVRGIPLGDNDEDEFRATSTTGNNSDIYNNYYYPNKDEKVSPAPIISPLPKYGNVGHVEMRDMSHMAYPITSTINANNNQNPRNINEVKVEIGEPVELESSHQEKKHTNFVKDNSNKEKWDMTPLGE